MRSPCHLLFSTTAIVLSLQDTFNMNSMMQTVAFQFNARRVLTNLPYNTFTRASVSTCTGYLLHTSSTTTSTITTHLHRQRNHKRNHLPFLRTMSLSAKKSDSEGSQDRDKEAKTQKKPKSRKIKLGDPNKVNLEALTAAFDEMARKEGFDESTAFYADDSTFEDDFLYDKDMDEAMFDSDDDDEMMMSDDDDDFESEGSNSMDDRIAAAKRDMDLGRVSITDDLSSFSKEVTTEQLKNLGFRPETNPFGNDETPRREQFVLITDARKCSACGSNFQTSNELKPGYLPPQKFQVQMKLAKIEDAQKLQEKADSDEWSPEDEVEWLLQSGGNSNGVEDGTIDINQMAQDLGVDLFELTKKKVICKRCHGLQNFGEAPETLRPGWTNEPSLSQEKFRNLLLPLRTKPAVIVALVDLFDFSGSILPELDAIAGDNPVIVAANKADLLPSKMGQTRAETWVRRELEYLGVKSIANVGGAVRLVSCKTGFGIDQMLGKARAIAEDMDCDIYVVGAANAGKSTLINYILEKNAVRNNEVRVKKRAGNANKTKGAVTASPLPGTTLEFIKIDMGQGLDLYDTPGLLVPGTLTQRLTPAELKMVVPKK
jgi:Predicted GTPases